MPSLLSPMLPVRGLLSVLRPLSWARRNAADAFAANRDAARRRTSAACSQAHALGPASWVALSGGTHRSGPAHGLDLCVGDADQVAHLCDYVVDGLTQGETVVVVATATHREGLHHRLALCGVRPEPGRLVELDADETLATLLTDGRVDAESFERVVATEMRALLGQGRPVRAYGEMVELLHARDDLAGAVELERLWEQLLDELPITLLCAYHRSGDAEAEELLEKHVRPQHTHGLAR